MRGKTAIVTGGAKGIGKAICIALAKEGANIILNYNSSESDAKNTANECETHGVKCILAKGDVSNAEDCKKIVEMAIKEFKSVDILINNAGINKDNLLMRMSDDEFNDVININLKGTFNMLRAVSRPMMKQRGGKIVNISSVVGIMGNAGQANYSASKAGIIGLTKSCARELAPRNINVNVIAPGFILTDMTQNLSEEIKNTAKTQIPLSAFGTGEDIANAAVFLASDKANYITGQTLSIDGGMSMI